MKVVKLLYKVCDPGGTTPLASPRLLDAVDLLVQKIEEEPAASEHHYVHVVNVTMIHYIRLCIYIYIYIYVYMYVCVYIYIYMCIYPYTYIHI